ncbi:polysaccharide biosynthesis/export family protein [Pedobacter duraquae]|uniref:Polysaccharide export outer membrane protein n=1 Tax=Pedobacter duraquae TaxID=425511 RepID=A0A4R6I9Z1_9SPHI|nr:polysaccharide biosynthesis/export family protein [Pedobacter duraquae]TDO19013.1 polysaccharide export outer membrane protein [Pedobacter duraquae]
MNKHYLKKNSYFLIAIISVLMISSCANTKNVPYFQDINATGSSVMENTAVFTEPKIQVDDILSISLFTIDEKTSMIVNQLASQAISSAEGQVSSLAATPPTSGFLVDKNGEIDLAIVGKIKVLGLTSSQAKNIIQDKAALFFQKPNVQVRFANFKVTIMGEVVRPAPYTIPNEKVSVLDALGLAGDLTIYGRRENILLIRDNDGKKEFVRLNLNSSQLFNSPYFYLKQNDVLYVEPNKGKAASLNVARTQTIAIIGTALTVLITLIARL